MKNVLRKARLAALALVLLTTLGGPVAQPVRVFTFTQTTQTEGR